ncbi:YceI family protein [Segetibacter aerophilus]|uniref:Lipid/polyisoprenoid-binding YceI-like domain-containing protein n=1 Tax=Segetibacter aerophilus TaxID=670293 RepID=A0A512BI72_9BACT|nr:YceI family protein [Segetibacter aerophilus]GEO11565.1 hypothetical protein SAE01_40610 [Segetibacter aerophilus]
MLTYSRQILFVVLYMILLLPLFAIAESNDKGMKKQPAKWAVQKSSTLRIQGLSNVNNFGCDITGYYQPDTLICFEENPLNKTVPLKGALEIDVFNFDCHNKRLTSDLRKTLKAKEYPKLVIRFLSLERNPVMRNSKDVLKGTVQVELAGSSKCFDIFYTFEKTETSFIKLNGNQNFSFADFKLSPPSKLAGLVKVKDRFVVDFNLLLQPVN